MTEFTKKHYEKIQRGLNLTDEQIKDVINQIIRLNPKPGGQMGDLNKLENYVIPDFFVINNMGKLELSLNSKNAPDLRISEGYRDMLKEYDRGSKKDKRQKEAVLFIKQKIDAAKWFIDAIKQRQHTLLSTMQTIMEYQREFFLTGDETEMRPMILKDIAERTGLDISTVSRVANSKFVQTEFGTYRLKFFFSESLVTDSGEEVSTREVKKILSNLIEAESKKHPLSDEKLTDLLQEKGYNIARRTVAKYREQLNIPVARLRKRIIMTMTNAIQDLTDPAGNDLQSSRNTYPGIVRFFAHVFSYVFHPLFIPVYATYYLVFIHPGYFNGIDNKEKMLIVLRVLNNMVFFPAVTVFLLKGIGFVDSIFLRTQKERIIPYIASGIFFFWMFLVFRNQGEISSILTSFIFSVFISSSAALIANIYYKISMHAVGAGGFIGLLLVILSTNPTSPITLPFALTLLITGIVCTSRMIISDHSPKDIYMGLACGILCQLAGAWFIM